MIGVFYRCPSPGAPPSSKIGASVEPDNDHRIVEVNEDDEPRERRRERHAHAVFW